MKQYQLTHGGGIDDLLLEEREIPRPGPHEVLVRMRAASLNYRDLLIVTGRYPRNQQNTIVPLSDGAGEIVEVGSDVTRFRVGARVAGIFMQSWLHGTMRDGDGDSALGGSGNGVLCEYRLFDEQGVVALPAHLSFEEGACLPCAAVTAWHALFGREPVQVGHTVLILGTGGVATIALQLARAAGAATIVTSSSDAKLARMRELGATHLINYTKIPEWATAVRGADTASAAQRASNATATRRIVSIPGSLRGPGTPGRRKGWTPSTGRRPEPLAMDVRRRTRCRRADASRRCRTARARR